jgi:UDP-2-acetamido-3-amino-2,3-dideoxy-glucuronate N-acetyltransferase
MIDPTAVIHETACIDAGAQVGARTTVWHFSHIMPGAHLGDDCRLGQNVVVMSGVQVGNNVKIQNNVSLYEGVTLEDDVFCGPSCVFTNVTTPRSHVPRRDAYAPTVVERGASIGANATIVCGVRLGRYCLIGAGAVVTRDVPPYAIVAGVPGRVRGWACQCGIPLSLEDSRAPAGMVVCRECGDAYDVQRAADRTRATCTCGGAVGLGAEHCRCHLGPVTGVRPLADVAQQALSAASRGD